MGCTDGIPPMFGSARPPELRGVFHDLDAANVRIAELEAENERLRRRLETSASGGASSSHGGARIVIGSYEDWD